MPVGSSTEEVGDAVVPGHDPVELFVKHAMFIVAHIEALDFVVLSD